VIVSVLLVAGGLLLLREGARGQSPLPSAPQALAIAGALLVLASFTLDFVWSRSGEPPPFRWGVFGAGVCLGVTALGLAIRRGPGRHGREETDPMGMVA
jgi:hypothetical protein